MKTSIAECQKQRRGVDRPPTDDGTHSDTGQDSVVAQVIDSLGDDVVLIPIPRGQKRPADRGWQLTTVEKMADPGYVDRLDSGCNLGVLLGEPSGGLCTIDIDDDDLAEEFLSANPFLEDTLRTRRVRGCNIWIRVGCDYPRSTTIKTTSGDCFGEWRADGNQTLIFGEAIDRSKGETSPTRYRRISSSECPITISFGSINWPDYLELPWVGQQGNPVMGELIEQFGEPLSSGKNPRPNEWFWAGVYNCENHVLFEPGECEFYQYDGETGLWQTKTRARLLKELADRLLAASREPDFGVLAHKRSTAILGTVADALKGVAEQSGIFEAPKRIVHCANGVLKIEGDGTFSLCEFSPDFHSRNQSPIIFDESAECPRFLDELLLPAVSKEDAILIQKYTGLCLLGDNLIQRFLILDGKPGRGKSQLALVIQMLVGQVNCCELRTEQLGERFEIGRFRKKSLLVGVDVPGNFLMQKWASKLKGLVGGDVLSGELKNSNSADLPVRGNKCIVITSNSRLRVQLDGDAGAWRRRMLIVRYEAPPPGRKIPDFAGVLISEEGSGILNWALEGLEMLLADIEESGADITLSEDQNRRVDALLAESDSLRHFLEAGVEVAAGEDLSTDEIHIAYGEYCAEMHWNAMPMSTLSRELPDLMLNLFTSVKSNKVARDGGGKVRGYRCVRLREGQQG